MRHEKILKRQDDSKVRIVVQVLVDITTSKPHWDFTVYTCEKGKRTWAKPYDNDYTLRRLSVDERAKFIREKSLAVASSSEIESAMQELWEMLRPSL